MNPGFISAAVNPLARPALEALAERDRAANVQRLAEKYRQARRGLGAAGLSNPDGLLSIMLMQQVIAEAERTGCLEEVLAALLAAD